MDSIYPFLSDGFCSNCKRCKMQKENMGYVSQKWSVQAEVLLSL